MALDFHRKLKLIRQIPKPLPIRERANYTLENARPGGLLEIENNLHLVVGETHYMQGKTPYKEFNLVDIDTGQKRFLEFGEEDELVINFWHTTGIPLSKIEYDNNYFLEDHGIPDVRSIKLFLDLCNKYDDGEITYKGQTLYFYESLQATWTGDGKKETQKAFNKHRYWDFLPIEAEEDNEIDLGMPIVSIERWFGDNEEDDEFDVNYGYRIAPEKAVVWAVGNSKK